MSQEFPPDHPFTAADAATLGVSRRRLRALLASGEVKQLLFGVYAPGHWTDGPVERARAAAHVVPDHCVLVDRSAASLHDIDVLDHTELDVPPDVELASIDGAGRTRRDGVLGGKRDLRPDEIMMIGGVRVTTPIRTACDIACLRGRWRAIAALDAFRTKFGIAESALNAMLPRYWRRRGVTQLRELIPLSRTGVDSQPESWIRIEMYDEGFPMPAAQVWAWVPGWGLVKVENAYEHLRIAVEYDGEEFHSEDGDRERDEARREALREAGWIIIVVRRGGLSGPGREEWLRELAAAFDERTPYQLKKRVYARSPQSRPRRRSRR